MTNANEINLETASKSCPTMISEVWVMVVASRQNDDSFKEFVDSVFVSESLAKAEMDRIRDRINAKGNKELRARNPIGQPNDLSIDFFDGKFWECRSFYSFNKKGLVHE